MRIQEVIDRALQDPVFAAELAAVAGKAARVMGASGQNMRETAATDEWKALVEQFADGPEELARLTTLDEGTLKAGPTTGTTGTTTTTITTTTTLACTITTTTTTTTTLTTFTDF